MTRLRRAVFLLMCLLASAGAAHALEAVSQTPTFETKVVLTSTPLVVVFDSSVARASVTPDSFFVEPWNGGDPLPGSFEFADASVVDDTVRFLPDDPWPWGGRLRLTITDEVSGVDSGAFTGALPDNGLFVANIPDDFVLPVWNPDDPAAVFVTTLDLIGYNPLDPDADAQPWQIPGSFVTEAWKYTTGRPDVVIAVVDTGVLPSDADLRTAFFLNQGELPLPNVHGAPCADYDCNDDGRFNVDDYAADDRVSHGSAVNAADLIAAFSDGVDNDGNGFVDDISGWDFFRDANEPWCANAIPTGCHGLWQASRALARADNGVGDRPGSCPGCTLLPLRTSTMILHGGPELAAAVEYAAAMGASAINVSGVALTWSDEADQAVTAAKEAGALLVAASGDEMSFHHWAPACAEEGISVKSLFPLAPISVSGGPGLGRFAFTETFATDFGPHTHLSVSTSTYSTSESTSITAGSFGLIQSRARDLGLELTADEVKQILIASADDIADHCASVGWGLNVCQPGFDEHFGYGRLNLRRAMDLLGDPDRGVAPAIPPSVRLLQPQWWETLDPTVAPQVAIVSEISSRVAPYEWAVEIAAGQEPLEAEFHPVASGDGDGPFSGTLATLTVRDFISDQWASRPPQNQHTFEVTLRVRASYAGASGAVTGEDRKTISVRIDRDPATGLIPGFPIDLGASGESAPVLYDLDGDADGRLEIVLGTGAGSIVALKYGDAADAWETAPGFPVDLSATGRPAADAIFSSVAVGDLYGDGRVQIVAATTQGLVYAIDPQAAALGQPVIEGFPVAADPPPAGAPLDYGFGNGFLGAPALADLNGDGVLEIIAASQDQKVYAWTPAGEDGRPGRLPGWPVTCRSAAGAVRPDLVCEAQPYAVPIMATPAVGFLDLASPHVGDHPTVIVATNEACAGNPLPRTRVYAIHHDGVDNPDGPFLRDWPAAPEAPLSEQLLALAVIAGASANPAVYVDASGAHIVIGVTGWFPQIIHYADGVTTVERVAERAALSAVGSPAITAADNAAGDKQIFMPMVGVIRFDELGFQLEDAAVYGFAAPAPHDFTMTGKLEGLPLLTSVASADLDGDGRREALAGTGGYLLHAFKPGGGEPSGWPKYTQKWMAAAPAVGDLDGDGLLEVVAMSREGTLYAWETEGPACSDRGQNSDWARYGHDERNTGFYGTDATPPLGATDLRAARSGATEVRLDFTAPGDDWACGSAAAYDVRYTSDPDADLSDPEVFASATMIDGAPWPGAGGTHESFVIPAPSAAHVAVQVIDGTGNRSRLVAAAVEAEGAKLGWRARDDGDLKTYGGCGR